MGLLRETGLIIHDVARQKNKVRLLFIAQPDIFLYHLFPDHLSNMQVTHQYDFQAVSAWHLFRDINIDVFYARMGNRMVGMEHQDSDSDRDKDEQGSLDGLQVEIDGLRIPFQEFVGKPDQLEA